MSDATIVMPVGPGRIYSPDPRDKDFVVTEDEIRALADTAKDRRAWKISGITNQGDQPHCVGHAWSGFLNAAPIMTRQRTLPSPLTIYTNAQKIDEWEGEDYEGTSVRAGAKYLQQKGLILEYHWIYDRDTLDEYLNVIGPVVVGIDWFAGMDRTRGGYVTPEGRWRGGHAFYVIDKHPNRMAYQCVNSWDYDWGEQGKFWIDEQDMEYLLFALNGEACTAIET
jgi:hypothetical protein